DGVSQNNDIWLWSSVDRLLRALEVKQFLVKTFVAYPPVFGSWHVDVAWTAGTYRVVADGKDRCIIVQSLSALDEWSDIRMLAPDSDGSWIDETIKTLRLREA
ncbi:MAG: hypothetical protein ABIQ97_02875, partial [Lysobacteraceae bacterium]